MTAILNFTICRKMVSSTAWHTTEMDSAQNFHIETRNEVLCLKNAYRSLFRAIFHFFVLTTQPSITKISLKITYLKFHSNFPGANELENKITNSNQ